MLALLALAPLTVLSLGDAVTLAKSSRPSWKQARQATLAAEARAGQARSGLLPQLSGFASYKRTTSNFTLQPGQVPNNLTGAAASTNTYDFYSFSLQVQQQLYDFQQTIDRFRAAGANAEAQRASEKLAELALVAEIRTNYFAARAQKDLVRVAEEALRTQDAHKAQVEGLVRVGTRPEIDLAQARLDHANARVQLITAGANLSAAKAQLVFSLGRPATLAADFDLADDLLEGVGGEDDTFDTARATAERARPEMTVARASLRAAELTVSSVKGGFGPALNANMLLTYAGNDINALVWNWSFSVTASWQLFSGLNTWEQLKEQRANLETARLALEQQRQQIALDVDKALLALRSAKASLSAADEALAAAQERLRLATGRYAIGVGNAIELGDAQLARTQAASQRVQAGFALATARTQLLLSLGREK